MKQLSRRCHDNSHKRTHSEMWSHIHFQMQTHTHTHTHTHTTTYTFMAVESTSISPLVNVDDNTNECDDFKAGHLKMINSKVKLRSHTVMCMFSIQHMNTTSHAVMTLQQKEYEYHSSMIIMEANFLCTEKHPLSINSTQSYFHLHHHHLILTYRNHYLILIGGVDYVFLFYHIIVKIKLEQLVKFPIHSTMFSWR